MRTRLDNVTHELDATVKVNVREVLDLQSFEDLFQYLLAMHKGDLKAEAISEFDLVESADHEQLSEAHEQLKAECERGMK